MKMPEVTGIIKLLWVASLAFVLMSCGGGGGSGASSTNANLSNLTLSAAALEQTFSSSLITYTASVTNAVTETTVTATLEDSTASMTVNGVAVTSGNASAAIALAAGDNPIPVVVTAQDGTTQKTYSITLSRESAFSNRSAEPVVFLADRETEGVTELYVAFDDASNAEPIKLSEALVSGGKVVAFSISQDKSFIAYLAEQEVDNKVELYVLAVDASNANYRTAAAYKVSGVLGNSADVRSFGWSPDSTRLVFLADADIDEVDELYMVDVDGNNLHKVNGIVSTTVEIGDYSWSPDSRYVAYKVYNRHLPNQVIGVNSHDSTVSSGPGFSVRLNPTLTSGGYIKSFAWSPDFNTVINPGQPNLVYLAEQDVVGQLELYRSVAGISMVSTEVYASLAANESVTEYEWSPDGEYIAFLVHTAGVNANLYSRVSSLGPPAIRHSVIDQVRLLAWSPNSQRIAFINTTALSDGELFYVTPNSTASPVRLSGTPVIEFDIKRFAWSPDSSSVAYLADQDSDEVFELYVSQWIGSVTGAKVSGSMVSDGDVQAFAWSPDSSLLAYRADAISAGVDALFTSHVAGDWTARLVSSSSPPASDGDVGVFSFSWAENSSALSYHAADTSEAVLELYSSLADGGAAASTLSGTLVDKGDVTRDYAYEHGKRAALTRQTRMTNLFKDGSFIEHGTNSELCGVVYDPVGDALLINQCVHVGNHKILKYSFNTHNLTVVHEYSSQNDYGLRLFGDELWMVRTYDKGFQRYIGLQDDRLLENGAFFAGSSGPELNEIYDLTLSEGDLYIVAGNPLGSIQHNGIQRINGPVFNTITELVSDVSAGWPNEPFNYQRSIISVGTGSNARLIVATGLNGDLERWDLSGNFVNRVVGFGSSYLQKDTQEKVYALFTNVTNSSLTRWTSDLAVQEVFPFTSRLNNGFNTRFALREHAADIEILMTSFRDRDPRFYSTRVPK